MSTSYGSICGPEPSAGSTQRPLTNQDVLDMLKAGLSSEIVAAKIRASSCHFDTSPSALKDMKGNSVPDDVVLAMIQAPLQAPSANASVVEKRPPEVAMRQSAPPRSASDELPRSTRSAEYPIAIRVLQAEQVPYSVQVSGGQISTDCNISGSTSTTGSAIASGNTAWGSSTSYSSLRMNCNTYQTAPVGWRHVLNAMLVVASNGNAYIIACDAAWRWSKCRPLIAGDTFEARMTSKGLAVEYALNGKTKESTYAVLQAKVIGR
ncbi:MAG: hypothetical protein ACYDDS_12435 [Candidatus Sulfotelmatobacter sp.]